MPLTEWQNDRSESWRRIRVGVTGLAGIVLLIGLASAMLEQLTPGLAPVAAAVNGPQAKSGEADKEPLAELGVAPGAAGSSGETAPPKK